MRSTDMRRRVIPTDIKTPGPPPRQGPISRCDLVIISKRSVAQALPKASIRPAGRVVRNAYGTWRVVLGGVSFITPSGCRCSEVYSSLRPARERLTLLDFDVRANYVATRIGSLHTRPPRGMVPSEMAAGGQCRCHFPRASGVGSP